MCSELPIYCLYDPSTEFTLSEVEVLRPLALRPLRLEEINSEYNRTMKLAQGVDSIFGKISPPPGVSSSMASDPVGGLAKLIGTTVNLFVVSAGLILLIYMLWGAFDWIVSEGDKERVAKAQAKITNALIGMVLVFVVLVVFGVLTGQILGIIENEPGVGWKIKIPHL